LNTYRAGADDGGHFGRFGGRFVAETLMPLILEVSGLANAAPLATAFILVALGYAATTIMLVPVALAFRELCGWSGPPAPAGTGS